MKRFKDFLKDLREEKLLTKEEDGGVMTSGEVSAPSDSTDSSEIIEEPKRGDQITTTDILGKCDHNHDGFFGPGCFHRPFAIFSKPISRLPKKKKKIKYVNLLEDEGYQAFEKLAKNIIEREMEAANDYVSKIDPEIHVSYENDYDFSSDKEDWVAAYDKETQENVKDFKIAFNLPVLFTFLDENDLANDEKELGLQIKISLYHELAHAILQYFQDEYIFDFELSEMEEEKIAEEFAKYQLKDYTDVRQSKLEKFIKEIFD